VGERVLNVPHVVPVSRTEAAARLLEVLADACESSDAFLIGSMAEAGHADAFSDIDVRWAVPAPEGGTVGISPGDLGPGRAGGVVESRRRPAGSAEQRLVFVRFADWPLTWRVDLHFRSEGLQGVEVKEQINGRPMRAPR
jgi:hypothetical protein